MVLSGFIRKEKPDICAFLQQLILARIDEQKNIAMDTATTCMIFDSLSNPYFSKKFKIKLLTKTSGKLKIQIDPEQVLRFVGTREWFFTWDEDNLAPGQAHYKK